MISTVKPLPLLLALGLSTSALAGPGSEPPIQVAAETSATPKATKAPERSNVVEKRIVITRVGEDGIALPPLPPIPPLPPLPEVINLQLPNLSGLMDGANAFIGQEFTADGGVVSGAPYSAEAVSERVQTLLDGNRLVKKSVTRLYRDEQGRTRQEILAEDGSLQNVFIFDPVAGVHYLINPVRKSATKLPFGKAEGKRMIVNRTVTTDKDGKLSTHEQRIQLDGAQAQGKRVIIVDGADAKDASAASRSVANQSLGSKDIEGIKAEGTQLTRTIAAGQVGNEKPIQIVTERWYSPDLKLVLSTTTRDPRSGVSSYKLGKLKRGEPDAGLFKVPADFKVRDVLASLPKPPEPPAPPKAPAAPKE